MIKCLFTYEFFISPCITTRYHYSSWKSKSWVSINLNSCKNDIDLGKERVSRVLQHSFIYCNVPIRTEVKLHKRNLTLEPCKPGKLIVINFNERLVESWEILPELQFWGPNLSVSKKKKYRLSVFESLFIRKGSLLDIPQYTLLGLGRMTLFVTKVYFTSVIGKHRERH